MPVLSTTYAAMQQSLACGKFTVIPLVQRMAAKLSVAISHGPLQGLHVPARTQESVSAADAAVEPEYVQSSDRPVCELDHTPRLCRRGRCRRRDVPANFRVAAMSPSSSVAPGCAPPPLFRADSASPAPTNEKVHTHGRRGKASPEQTKKSAHMGGAAGHRSTNDALYRLRFPSRLTPPQPPV